MGKVDIELDNSVYANSTIETINHDIAAYITKLLEDGTLQPAFDRYMYSQDCFDIGDSILTLLSAYQKGEISKDEAMARNFEYAKLYLR